LYEIVYDDDYNINQLLKKKINLKKNVKLWIFLDFFGFFLIFIV